MNDVYLIVGCAMWFLGGIMLYAIIDNATRSDRIIAFLMFIFDVIMAIWNIYLAVR